MADTEGARRRRAPMRPGDENTDEPTAPVAPAGRARKAAGAAKKTTKAAPGRAAATTQKAAAKKAAAKKAATETPATKAPATKRVAGEKAPAKRAPARKAPAKRAAAPEPPPILEDEADEPRPPFGRSGLRAALAEAAARAAAEEAAGRPAASSLASTSARPWSTPAEPVEPIQPEAPPPAAIEPETAPAASAPPAEPAGSPPVTAATSQEDWRSSTTETAVLPQVPTAAPAAAPTVPRPPSERPSRGGAGKAIGLVVGIAVAMVVVAVAAFFLIGKITDKGGVKYSDLKVGDCLQRPSGSFDKVKTVACTTPHDLEVYALLDHPAAAKAPYTSTDDLIHYANPLCLAQFKTYAGVPFEQLNLQDFYITPRKSVWDGGVRRIVCVVGSGDNSKTSKSIKAGA